MKEVINRLAMIKNAILLEDEEVLNLQVHKLSQLILDVDAMDILTLLKDQSFATVIDLIESYCQRKVALISYDDKEVAGLRLELKILEAEYEELVLQNLSIEALVNDFNQKYYHSCGKLIKAVLWYRAKLQQNRVKEDLSNPEKRANFKEAKNDYEEFNKEYQEKIEEPLVELSEDDEKELKNLYRKASALCHPDKVSEEFKEHAGEIFKQLSIAYKAKDRKKVSDIYSALKTNKGISIFSDTVSDADKLRSRILKVKESIQMLHEKIKQAKQDETYQKIEIISDWDAYFRDVKRRLQDELLTLKEAVGEVTV